MGSAPRVIGRSWRMSQSGRRRASAAIAAALALGVAACGGDDRGAVAEQGTSAVPAATSPAGATVPTTTTPAPATGATQTEPTATTGVPPGGSGPSTVEGQPGGAGDEEPMRVPAAFRVEPGKITPATITVPAFLPVALAITSVGERRTVTVGAPGAGPLDVAAGGTARRTLDGLKPGDYAITAADGARATLRVTPGGDPGP